MSRPSDLSGIGVAFIGVVGISKDHKRQELCYILRAVGAIGLTLA